MDVKGTEVVCVLDCQVLGCMWCGEGVLAGGGVVRVVIEAVRYLV